MRQKKTHTNTSNTERQRATERRRDAARPLPLLLRRRANTRRRKCDHDEQHRATQSSVGIGKREETRTEWTGRSRRRTTRRTTAAKTKARGRAGDAERCDWFVIGGERAVDGGDEDDDGFCVFEWWWWWKCNEQERKRRRTRKTNTPFREARERIPTPKELAERARGEDSTRLSQKLMDAETIKNRFQSQLRECREALETKEKELKRLREHLLDVEEAEDRDEMSIEERVEEEKRRVEEKFEKEVERLSMQLMEKEDGLNRKIKEVENLNRALGSFYADQEQMDGRTNEAKEARQKLRETSGKLRETMELLEKKTMEMEELERKRGRAEEKFKDASRKCAEATAQSTKLRVALTQAIKKIARLSSSSAGCDDGENEVFIDKSVITKLLVTYFERNFSEEVLELMSRLLNMEDSQREAIVLGARRATGVISKVARAPLGIARGVGKAFGAISGVGLRVVGATGENAEVPVADLFIDFLLKEAEEELNNNDASTAEEEEKENSTPLPKSPSSERGGIFSAVDVE